jgi:predicted metalloprotease with PDZ domain
MEIICWIKQLSKNFYLRGGLQFLCLLYFIPSQYAYSQELDIDLKINSVSHALVTIEGTKTPADKRWSFPNIYAGVVGLGQRIKDFSAFDKHGNSVPVRQIAAGEYQSEEPVNKFRYQVVLDVPSNKADMSHISWITSYCAVIMLFDLLPTINDKNLNSKIRFALPEGWFAVSTQSKISKNEFKLRDLDNAIFFLGEGLRENQKKLGKLDFTLVTRDEWVFKNNEVLDLASRILNKYKKDLGDLPPIPSMLVLIQLPESLTSVQWSAETRGSNIVLLSKREPSKIVALSKLGGILTHELLHLWVPNSLNLSGNYDWFYEGFTLYCALSAGVQLELLTFQDYLNSIGRAYDIYRAAAAEQRENNLSLIEASERRWTGNQSLLYNKGMLVAFLYDLTLRYQTRGKRSLYAIFSDLFQRYGGKKEKVDGNMVVLDILSRTGEMAGFTKRFIENSVRIKLDEEIARFGIVVSQPGARTHLTVSASIDKAQQNLLQNLGHTKIVDRTR